MLAILDNSTSYFVEKCFTDRKKLLHEGRLHSHLHIFIRKALRQILCKCLRTNCVLRKVLLTSAYFCT